MFPQFCFRWLAAAGFCLVAGLCLLEWRLIHLQVARHPELLAKAERFTKTRHPLEPWRGAIKDRFGAILATSSSAWDVYVNLAVCSNHLARITPVLASVLGLDRRQVVQALYTRLPDSGPKPRPPLAVLLRHKVPGEEWEWTTNRLAKETFGFPPTGLSRKDQRLLGRLRCKSLFARPRQTRAYPFANSLCHLLGYVSNATNAAGLRGASGLEARCDPWLAGLPGLCLSEQDLAGNELPFRRKTYQPPLDGCDVTLTIDMRLQQIAEACLAEAVRRHGPRHASVLLVRPRTGEVLAWASWPDFNPQNPCPADPAAWTNHPLSDHVEPGSTFKVFILAAVLEERLAGLEDWIEGEHGHALVNGVRVRDHASYGLMTLEEALAKSSNVAFAKLGCLLGGPRMRSYLTKFGFGQATGVPLAGEAPGWLPPGQAWPAITLTRAAFGQGLAVTQLQMAMALSAIANDGRLMRPLLVSRIEMPGGRIVYQGAPRMIRQVLQPETARQVRAALQAAVSPKGTGARAALETHTVGGKTGTAQKSDRNGYLPDKYYSSFIGLLPADRPELCIAVALDEPQDGYYGGSVAAPVFRAIAEQAAALLGLPPDKLPANLVRTPAGQESMVALAD